LIRCADINTCSYAKRTLFKTDLGIAGTQIEKSEQGSEGAVSATTFFVGPREAFICIVDAEILIDGRTRNADERDREAISLVERLGGEFMLLWPTQPDCGIDLIKFE